MMQELLTGSLLRYLINRWILDFFFKKRWCRRSETLHIGALRFDICTWALFALDHNYNFSNTSNPRLHRHQQHYQFHLYPPHKLPTSHPHPTLRFASPTHSLSPSLAIPRSIHFLFVSRSLYIYHVYPYRSYFTYYSPNTYTLTLLHGLSHHLSLTLVTRHLRSSSPLAIKQDSFTAFSISLFLFLSILFTYILSLTYDYKSKMGK